MSTEAPSRSQKQGRLGPYLLSQLGRNSSALNKNEENGTSTPSRPSSSAQPAGNDPRDNPKPRKRDRFLNHFRGSASNLPPATKPFKRSTLEKDIAVLSLTYLMKDSDRLNELIVAIVALGAKCRNEKSNLLFGKCANFCVCLIQYVEGESTQASGLGVGNAVNAVVEFCTAVKDIEPFDCNLEASVVSAEERLEGSIKAIKASHPSLEGMQVKERVHRGLSGTALAIIDIGIPVLNVLKDAVEIIGAVPFLKPVFGAVLIISQAARQTQSNFDEMRSLSQTAGEFIISIAERCSTFRDTPPNLDDAVKKLECRLRAIALQCQEMSQKSFISCFFQTASLKDALNEQSRNLSAAIQEFQSTAVVDIQETLQKIANSVESGRLKELPAHPDMSGILAEYLIESRTSDVKEICRWIESSNELFLCIHGSAGVGKSTLAGHLSRELRATGRLAGAVYLGAIPTDMSSAKRTKQCMAYITM
ncbi:hypothetical protein MD484_g1686, partial [Candolleomyces efflorescens]